jgi:molybdopterin-guanine dinucleotide biosynthesis protein A
MHDSIAAVILAGGRGRRLGGADKALLPLAGVPLLAQVLARLRPQVGQIVLSANGDPARFAGFGLPVVADAAAGQGPLAGIAAAAADAACRWPAAEYLLTVPVDVPMIPADLCARLAAAVRPTCAAVALAGDRAHWTVALWPLAAAIALPMAMERQGLRRVEAALAAVGFVAVPFPDAAAFANLNRPEDRERLERRLIGC